MQSCEFVCVYIIYTTYCLLLTACCQLPIACCLLHIAWCLLRIAYCLLPFACCMLPITYCLLLIACCLLLLPIAYWSMPSACCLIHTGCCLLPAWKWIWNICKYKKRFKHGKEPKVMTRRAKFAHPAVLDDNQDQAQWTHHHLCIPRICYGQDYSLSSSRWGQLGEGLVKY